MSPPMELHLLGVCFPELIPPHFNPHRRVCKSHCCHRYLLKTACGAARRGVRGGASKQVYYYYLCFFADAKWKSMAERQSRKEQTLWN